MNQKPTMRTGSTELNYNNLQHNLLPILKMKVARKCQTLGKL